MSFRRGTRNDESRYSYPVRGRDYYLPEDLEVINLGESSSCEQVGNSMSRIHNKLLEAEFGSDEYVQLIRDNNMLYGVIKDKCPELIERHKDFDKVLTAHVLKKSDEQIKSMDPSELRKAFLAEYGKGYRSVLPFDKDLLDIGENEIAFEDPILPEGVLRKFNNRDLISAVDNVRHDIVESEKELEKIAKKKIPSKDDLIDLANWDDFKAESEIALRRLLSEAKRRNLYRNPPEV